jgi:hypothetical protein
MNITNAKYEINQITNQNQCIVATINGQAMSVPLDPANTDYQAIQEWVAEGNTIAEAD